LAAHHQEAHDDEPDRAERLAPVGMLIVEDGDALGLVPHRAFVHLADRATAVFTTPTLTQAHLEILGIVLNAGTVTRLGIEKARGLDSTEAVAQLVEWGLLRREGAEGRWPIYRGTAKLVEVTGWGQWRSCAPPSPLRCAISPPPARGKSDCRAA